MLIIDISTFEVLPLGHGQLQCNDNLTNIYTINEHQISASSFSHLRREGHSPEHSLREFKGIVNEQITTLSIDYSKYLKI